MKGLLTIQGTKHKLWLADPERPVFGIDGEFYTANAENIPHEDSFLPYPHSKEEQDAMDAEEDLRRARITGGISSFSTIEETFEIDDIFGNYGFKDAEGNVIIEPQFESVLDFSQGLCAVCAKRTWYHTLEGERYYETLWGYIDMLGKVRIPYMFQEASRFNKYGVAVVADDFHDGWYLIDTTGKIIEDSLFPMLSRYYNHEERYLEFSYHAEQEKSWKATFDCGLYDTKERRIAISPCADSFIVWDDNLIEAFHMISKITGKLEQNLYIDGKGNELFPWQLGRGFDTIDRIDKEYNTVVGYEIDTGSIHGGRQFREGLLNKEGEMVIPAEYRSIRRIGSGYYACEKDGTIEIVTVI